MQTQVALQFPVDIVDEKGQARLMPEIRFPTSNGPGAQDLDIAPWDEPPSPPPKRSFGFPHKPSFSSTFVHGSTSTLNLLHRNPVHRPSTSSTLTESSYASSSTLELPQAPQELRKSKSSMFSNLMRKKSKGRLRSGSSEESEHSSMRSLPPPLPENYVSILPLRSRSPQHPSMSSSKRSKRRPSPLPPTPPPKDDELKIDLDFDNLAVDGIVHPAAFGGGGSSPTHARSYSSDNSSSLRSLDPPSFSNPFSSQPPRSTSKHLGVNMGGVKMDRKISPKTVVPSDDPDSPSWVAPESWAVDDGMAEPVDEYSSSEDSALGGVVTGGGRPLEFNHSINRSTGSLSEDSPLDEYAPRCRRPSANNVTSGLNSLPPILVDMASRRAKKKGRKVKRSEKETNGCSDIVSSRPTSSLRSSIASLSQRSGRGNYTIRVYRANNTYHMVQVGFQVTVADLTPRLNAKLLLGEDREGHRLYLKERGRERLLGPTERPADIVRRRLEQAGYDPADGLDILAGEGLIFLLKFVYKSQLLGPADTNLTIDSYDMVDLSGTSLRTIPVVLHKHADQITCLYLSRNPMLEIPLDFIQSCTTLRELRLSNMAMKKVPHSVRHSKSLHRLDISCNRIAELDEAVLDDIPELNTLNAQNNRMEKLPWYFPRLRSLVTLNISNNKFRVLPDVVCDLKSLKDLDVSFNIISELPEKLGQLISLERFIMVGNQVRELPAECAKLVRLEELDCRRNNITDLSPVCMLPRLRILHADSNKVHALDLSVGPSLVVMECSHNEITQVSLAVGRAVPNLTTLDLSYQQLYSLDDLALGQLTSLRSLKLNRNQLQVLPESLGELEWLEMLSCADNNLKELPASIGRLQKLETLDAHANSLTELPDTLWNCASLMRVNLTSNLLVQLHVPAEASNGPSGASSPDALRSQQFPERKASASSLSTLNVLPPLAHALEMLYLGENQLTDDVLHPLTIFRELRVLNLSFNDIAELPNSFFKNLVKLEELYLSGNKLTCLPTEDLPKLTRLSVMFLNGNRLQTLPQELGKVKSLTVLDVGSNLLKYNINNWEFDWNWNFNKNLKYLNLSGNKRLQIKSDVNVKSGSHNRHSRDLASLNRQSLAGFTDLQQLRVLGLMDVTITTTGMNASIDIPDETDDRRVRTSLSTVNGMAYGIADTLGKNDHLNMLDLVHEFPGRKDEAVFAMFGRAEPPKGLPITTSSNKLAKFLRDGFISVLLRQLEATKPQRDEDYQDALRRSFLILNQDLHDFLFSHKSSRKMSAHSQSSRIPNHDISVTRSGASGVVLYLVGRRMYIANVGNALAVVSRGGRSTLLSTRHDPYDRSETARIRTAEGWVSPPGLVNDELDISRSFGFFHLLPVVNARPHVTSWQLSELDEFVIIGNRGLWDYVNYQTAVDIARREPDPMIAAQKLRDFAISYGAKGSTMIMVIAVADLFKTSETRARQTTQDSVIDPLLFKRPRRLHEIADRGISRLPGEVPPPTGHLALVFTDIKNSTHLWEVNPGMPTAMRLHNNLLRRQLRFCGGYEVKTEGDAFICSFPSTLSAVWWCLTVQVQLIQEQWPLEITEAPDGKEILDADGRVIAKGLSVRMGIHCGTPFCEPDPITKRMDYIGPMVNRSARIGSAALGGQIMCSADVIREINAKIFETEPETEFSDLQSPEAIDAIKRLGIVAVPVGEIKLKGLEVPEMLSVIYPNGLEGRQYIGETPEATNVSGSRIPFSVAQMRDLGILCLRLEALSMGRIFKQWPERKGSQTLSVETMEGAEDEAPSIYLYGDPAVLLPPMNDKSSDSDMMLVMDSLSGRIDNAIAKMGGLPNVPSVKDVLATALMRRGGLDDEVLQTVLNVLQGL